MKLLLLGASGRTGKLVLKELLNKGYTVNCLVRKQPEQQLAGANYLIGSPDDKALMKNALDGCEAVISVLNISRASDFPWAKLRTPERFLSGVMNILIPLARDKNIKRIIACSAWGVLETKAHIPAWFRWLIDHSNIGAAYADHERQEKILQQSGLNWTIVRPAALINSRKSQRILESYRNEPQPKLTISRLSVARYLADALSNDSLIGKTPVISA